VVGLLLVIEMPDSRHMRHVAILPCPVDRFLLRRGDMEHVVGVIFDDIVGDGAPLRPAFGLSRSFCQRATI
jgi:hypothetical protein